MHLPNSIRVEIHCPYCGIELNRFRNIPATRWVRNRRGEVEPQITAASERVLRAFEKMVVKIHECGFSVSSIARAMYE